MKDQINCVNQPSNRPTGLVEHLQLRNLRQTVHLTATVMIAQCSRRQHYRHQLKRGGALLTHSPTKRMTRRTPKSVEHFENSFNELGICHSDY